MTLRTTTPNPFDNSPIPVQAKLAAAWVSLMFLYIYVDYLTLYVPGFVADLAVGVLIEVDITQAFVVTALALVAIPILMILLSTMLPARANRITNLVVASLYLPVSISNAVGASWLYYYGLGVVLEVILLAVILRLAWTWPRRTAAPATRAPLDSEPLRTPQQA